MTRIMTENKKQKESESERESGGKIRNKTRMIIEKEKYKLQ